MAAMSPSPEQRELTLINKVEMRIALADSDSKLEATLKTYLAPLLLKLVSEHHSVRNKVITVCQHINTRVKPQSIQLPVVALAKQFKEQDSQLIRHFDLLYIQQGVDRLSPAERTDLIPIIINGISKSGTHASQVFNLLLRLLEHLALPLRGSKEDSELRIRMNVSDEDAEYLALWMGKILLFVPQRPGSSTTCPGLTQEDYAFFMVQGKENPWDPAAGGLNLLTTKTLAAKMLATGLFNDKERFLPALIASAEPASAISDVGEDMMKRALPATDLEDENLVAELYDLYFGIAARPRVRAPLRLRILGLFNKSLKSTTFAHRIMDLVDDGIATPVMDGDDVVMSNAPATQSSTKMGREATKLRSAIFSYINYVARFGAQDTLYSIASRVICRLRDFIDNQGWPKPGPNEDLMSRGHAYEVIGLLAKAGPRAVLVEEEHLSLDLLRWLFNSLAKDSAGNSITVSIEDALSTILSAMASIDLHTEEQFMLEDLLISQMEMSENPQAEGRIRSTRYVAVRFANRCLPYTSVRARWVDILGLGATDDRPEVREESERGLDPYWYRMLNGTIGMADEVSTEFPTFDAVVNQFFVGRTTNRIREPMAVAREANRQYPAFFHQMAGFARMILFHEAMSKGGVAIGIDSDWQRKVDTAVESDVKAREAVKSYLLAISHGGDRSLEVLQCVLFENAISRTTTSDNALVDFLALAPNSLTMKLVPNVDLLLPVLQVNHYNRRTAAARAFGLLASHQTADMQQIRAQSERLLETARSWSSAVGAASSRVHGSIVALGYLLSRSHYRKSGLFASDDIAAFVSLILQILSEARDDLLKEASYSAIGQLCMFGVVNVASVEATTSVKTIVDKLYETAKGGNEHAISCMGEISMILPEDGENEESNLAYLEQQLHKLHEIRQAEVHFTVGEAFSYLASGWKSEALATKLDVQERPPKSESRMSTLPKLAEKILKYCTNTKPTLKKAAVMWLLCLVQFCGSEQEIQDRLPLCQVAFKRCLSDRDELVQETASRGLGLVYEKGDRKIKDDLVRDLVSSFSSDKQSQLAGSVSADTQLFEPGALPTGDGSVSTYKDIMSLASEVGDSSLVYRFMSMASSNAIWSSRAAFGRFGLSNVLSDSSVDGYLADNPKLYPKLFRYRFDPNGGVQRSMNDIWNALVKDSSTTIDKYFNAIMEDLLVSILGKEWRVRQASCAAIADLVSSRPLDKYEGYLERIWTQCFRVLDDIKESVRVAAASLARTLTGVLTRALESDHSSTKNATAMLKHVLPFLLSPSGIESSAKDVQIFAVHTLLEIIKKANATTLRPFIPELVERLIGLLSSLEPEAVNYIHLNASKYNLTEQKIDDMRLSSVRGSPLMEAIERCLDLLDDDSMGQLKPRLESSMRSAVGLPSKVGASRVLVSLSTRRMVLFKPYSDDALKLIEKLVLDRNETVSSSYAVAAGYLARGASDKQILHLAAFAQRLYFESEGDREASVPRRAITAGEIVYALSKHASDRFNAIASSVLPFVFVAKHDHNESVKEQFRNTWDESVGGSRTISLYLSEIVDLSTKYLDSAQWTLKHTSAKAIADAVMAVASTENKISDQAAEKLWPAIEKALSGKTWEGKEAVLSAFVKFVESAQTFCTSDHIKKTVIKIATREAKRQNEAWRSHSVRAIGQIAEALHDSDLFPVVFDLARSILIEDESGVTENADGDARDRLPSLDENIKSAATFSLFAAINPALLDASHLVKSTDQILEIMATTPHFSILPVRKSTYDGLATLFDRIRSIDLHRPMQLNLDNLNRLLFGPEDNPEALRLRRADALVSISRAVPRLTTALRTEIADLTAAERSLTVRERLALIQLQ